MTDQAREIWPLTFFKDQTALDKEHNFLDFRLKKEPVEDDAEGEAPAATTPQPQ